MSFLVNRRQHLAIPWTYNHECVVTYAKFWYHKRCTLLIMTPCNAISHTIVGCYLLFCQHHILCYYTIPDDLKWIFSVKQLLRNSNTSVYIPTSIYSKKKYIFQQIYIFQEEWVETTSLEYENTKLLVWISCFQVNGGPWYLFRSVFLKDSPCTEISLWGG